MKRNKMLFVKRFYFVGFFVLLGTLNLFAQGEPNVAEELSALKEEISVLKEGYNKAIIIENYIPFFHKSIGEMLDSMNRLSNSFSEPKIWQVVLLSSVALIALLLLGVTVLILLKQLRLHVVVENGSKLSDEKSVNEHQLPKEFKTVSQEISPHELLAFERELENIQSQLAKLNDRINSQSEDSSGFQSTLTSFQTDMADFKHTIKDTNDTVSLLKNDIDKNREKLARKEQLESDPVAVFNQWAQNPHLPFPQYFTYVANVKLEFRTKQEFTDATIETEWIRNTIGEKKYLFPNPNKIDNLSGPIDKLYKVAGTRKAKGTNSVKITSACQIKEGNFIEYQGELTLM